MDNAKETLVSTNCKTVNDLEFAFLFFILIPNIITRKAIMICRVLRHHDVMMSS